MDNCLLFTLSFKRIDSNSMIKYIEFKTLVRFKYLSSIQDSLIKVKYQTLSDIDKFGLILEIYVSKYRNEMLPLIVIYNKPQKVSLLG